MSDIISIASPSKYNSFISLETVVYFVCDDVTKGNLIVESWLGSSEKLSESIFCDEF